MENYFIIRNQFHIFIIKEIIKRNNLKNDYFTLIVFSDELKNNCEKNGFHAKLFICNDANINIYTEHIEEIDNIARKFSARISELRNKYNLLNSNEAWDYFNLYYILLSQIRIKYNIYENINHFNNKTIFIPYVNTPQDYYFDSEMQSNIIYNILLKNTNSKIVKIEHQFNPLYNNEAWNNQIKINIGTQFILSSLPTVFYEINEIKEKYTNLIVDIPSNYFDVKLSNKARENVEIYNIKFYNNNNNEKYYSELSKIYRETLTYQNLSIDEEVIARQIDRLINKDYYAINLYNEINKHGHKITKIVISDHDTGNLGPISSICEKFEIETIVVPHSGFIANPIYITNKMYSEKLCGINEYLSLSQNRFRIKSEGKKKFNQLLNKRIAIILNEYDDVYGFAVLNFEEIIKLFINKLSELEKFGIDIYYIQKPNHLKKLETVKEDKVLIGIKDLYSSFDIAITLGIPTSALKALSDKGLHTFHITDRKLSKHEENFIPPNSELINEYNYKRSLDILINKIKLLYKI